jgi:hypothetical protein
MEASLSLPGGFNACHRSFCRTPKPQKVSGKGLPQVPYADFGRNVWVFPLSLLTLSSESSLVGGQRHRVDCLPATAETRKEATKVGRKSSPLGTKVEPNLYSIFPCGWGERIPSLPSKVFQGTYSVSQCHVSVVTIWSKDWSTLLTKKVTFWGEKRELSAKIFKLRDQGSRIIEGHRLPHHQPCDPGPPPSLRGSGPLSSR